MDLPLYSTLNLINKFLMGDVPDNYQKTLIKCCFLAFRIINRIFFCIFPKMFLYTINFILNLIAIQTTVLKLKMLIWEKIGLKYCERNEIGLGIVTTIYFITTTIIYLKVSYCVWTMKFLIALPLQPKTQRL